MVEASGTVVEVRDGLLRVETQPRSACAHCSTDSCASSVVAKLVGAKRNRVWLENTLGARPGEQVVIGIQDALLLRASLLSYLLPLVSMLAVAALGDVRGASEGLQGLLAAGGLAAGFALAGRIARGVPSRQRYSPQLLRFAVPGQVVSIERLHPGGTGNE
ncbi:MAG TPA: SoxR reducing system RseC family protein [Gammaproteobacteria bacterium]|nr:SoxR reducing system RseC family protein [Gammaproteobacteria bacterium]